MNLATDSPSYSEGPDIKAETASCFKKCDILKNVMLFIKAPDTVRLDLRSQMEVYSYTVTTLLFKWEPNIFKFDLFKLHRELNLDQILDLL
jgi:hypothetical protein